jgi:hypothetical protein
MCNAEQGYRTRSQNPPCSMLMQSRCSQCERVCRKIIMLVVERVPQQDVVLGGRQPVRGARTPKVVVSQLLSTSRPSFLPSFLPSKVSSPSNKPKSQIHKNTIPPKKGPSSSSQIHLTDPHGAPNHKIELTSVCRLFPSPLVPTLVRHPPRSSHHLSCVALQPSS